METVAHARALFNISFGVPSKGTFPPHGVPSETGSISRALMVDRYSRITLIQH